LLNGPKKRVNQIFAFRQEKRSLPKE